MIEEIQDSCKDLPSPLDYKASELLWAITWSKKTFPKDLLQIFNQWADKDTQMSCTRQWIANITNWNNLLWQWEQDILLAKKKWIEAYLKTPIIKTQWDYLQNALKQFLDDKLIAWYYVVKWKEEHKQAIDKGHYIFSGSNNWDWVSVRDNKIYKIKENAPWHAFVKWCDYNDVWLVWINSYWQNNWFFDMPWDLVDTTFTSYAIIDFVDEKEILIFNKKKMEERINRLIELWITNWKDRELNITRWDMMLMLWKLVEIIETKTWKLN